MAKTAKKIGYGIAFLASTAMAIDEFLLDHNIAFSLTDAVSNISEHFTSPEETVKEIVGVAENGNVFCHEINMDRQYVGSGIYNPKENSFTTTSHRYAEQNRNIPEGGRPTFIANNTHYSIYLSRAGEKPKPYHGIISEVVGINEHGTIYCHDYDVSGNYLGSTSYRKDHFNFLEVSKEDAEQNRTLPSFSHARILMGLPLPHLTHEQVDARDRNL